MFLIGEFSKISRVSKRLLHHYDEIDLLKPAYIDGDSGYRYYGAKQLPILNRILSLKDLGISLADVKIMIQDGISDQEIRGMLLLKKAEVEQSVSGDLLRLQMIEARLGQNTAEKMPDVVIKQTPAIGYLAYRTVYKDVHEMMPVVNEIRTEVPGLVSSIGTFTGIFYSDAYEETEMDLAVGYTTTETARRVVTKSGYELDYEELPAVESMASIVLSGVEDPELFGMGRIASWIETNGFRLNGPAREIVLAGGDFDNLTDTVIEIQVPVTSRT